MTTWQDQPPMSRRALREQERARAQEQQSAGSGAEENRSWVSTQESPPPPPSEHDYRAHDFSPEARPWDARGSSFSANGPEHAAASALPPPAAMPTSRASARVAEETGPIERTLTRRQIRALREQAERDAGGVIHPLVEPEPELERQPIASTPVPPISVPPVSVPWTPVPPAQDQEPEPEREIVPAPEYYQPPVGHWSTQHAIDDALQVPGSLSRDLSATNAITTSALVLPSLPTAPVAPVSGTGEILVTGTIDLPRSLGATGLHPTNFDQSDVDAMFEASDREDAAPNSAPVRAIRAVSTQTSSHGMIAAKRPQSRIPTMALAVCAAVMGVGVVVLFVGALVMGIF